MKNGKYILVKAPDEYPGKKYRGMYIYEHRLVWWLKTGNLVPSGHVIHHRDHNKHNNDINNLELISDKEHKIEHAKDNPVVLCSTICNNCNIRFILPVRSFKSRIKYSNNLYCCRSCQVSAQQKNKRKTL